MKRKELKKERKLKIQEFKKQREMEYRKKFKKVKKRNRGVSPEVAQLLAELRNREIQSF